MFKPRKRSSNVSPGVHSLAPARREFLAGVGAAVVSTVAFGDQAADAAPSEPTRRALVDPYARYVRNSRDFKSVRQDRGWCWKAFPGWLYMPWTYQWTIGYTEASGAWCRSHGYNGAFLDGNGGEPDSPRGKLDWINRFGLRFYLDHTAGKGNLHMWDGGKQRPHLAELHGNGVRTIPVNELLAAKLRGLIDNNVRQVKSSEFRAAYALDDETSWGHFVHPTMWQVTDDARAYTSWLDEVYGEGMAPRHDRWLTYEDIRPSLPKWTVGQFDASGLMDQWSFNDSYWCNFLGGLVEHANSVDGRTPCGIVGGQAPSPFGGYDYAKLMRKIQYIEAYNLGSSQAIIRSFNPNSAIPAVTSEFHQSADDDIWQVWYYLAHGNRGHIGWVENWFDGETPKPWQDVVAPHYLEASKKIGPLMEDASWRHDGVALYYSHPSIQLGWILDAEAHGKTWINRDGDHRLGASHLVRKAWENMLRDSGIQYNFLSYVDVIQSGIPAQYRVVILPACLCLSDVEAAELAAFCKKGGTVIADYMPGLWNQHGRGRPEGGALDDLFGVRHDSSMTSADVFGGRLWCEIDQDANFDWKTYAELVTKGNTCIVDQSGFHKAVRAMSTANGKRFGAGVAVLMNLSPQWYNAYRESGPAEAMRRQVFMRHLDAAGVRRWVELEEGQGGDPQFGYEITYFRKMDGRTILYLCWNPDIGGNEAGGGNAVGLKTGVREISLKFTKPVHNVRNERSGAELGSGEKFRLPWSRNEAVVLTFS